MNVSFATLAAAYCMATVGDLAPSSLPNGVWYNKQSISSKKLTHVIHYTRRNLLRGHCSFTTYCTVLLLLTTYCMATVFCYTRCNLLRGHCGGPCSMKAVPKTQHKY